MFRLIKKMESADDEPHEPPRAIETAQQDGAGSSIGSLSSSLDDLAEEITVKARRHSSWRSISSRGSQDEGPEPVRNPRRSSLLGRSATGLALSHLFSTKDNTPTKKLRRLSREATTSSTASSSSSDWKGQNIECHGALEPEGAVRPKSPYLIVTRDYIIRLPSRTDAIALFPELARGTELEKVQHVTDQPVTIPVSQVVAAFKAESTRPSFGIEIWWQSPVNHGLSRASFFFSLPNERENVLKAVHLVLVKQATNQLGGDVALPADIDAHLSSIALREDPQYAHQKPEIYPVVLRSNPRGGPNQGFQDLPLKTQNGPSYYLAISANLALLVELTKTASSVSQKLASRFYKMGLASLERFDGHWTTPEQRFVLQFRVPWEQPFSVDLASRYSRQIALTLLKACQIIKPAWPRLWLHALVFRVNGLEDFTSAISSSAGNDQTGYAALSRTLDSYLLAYRCQPVEWEVSFLGAIVPEFRLLPARHGRAYSALQLAAVLRALRYNRFFKSISLRDIDLSGLYSMPRDTGQSIAATVNPSGRTLEHELLMTAEHATLPHQEFLALAFGSESLQRFDFTAVSRTPRSPQGSELALRFFVLDPILDLIRTGSTRCTDIVLDRNILGLYDVDQLVKTLRAPKCSITGLSVAKCSLASGAMHALAEALAPHCEKLEILNISSNRNSISAAALAQLLQDMFRIQRLNVAGSVMGSMDGPLITCATLHQMSSLQELDLSGLSLNEETMESFTKYFTLTKTVRLRQLTLNNCHITGFGAARLFEAILPTTGQKLCIFMNGNPLEQGLDRLARAIRGNFGPAALHMDMIEFRDDSNFASLLAALAESSQLTTLSLVGTGFTGTCSTETTEAFKALFAARNSIRHLDISGYSGRLDEGQLGGPFGLALDWLCKNRSLTHLRIRNQNLNEHREQLGRMIEQNQALRFLDLEENGFSVTTLGFLATCMLRNHTILAFALSSAETERIWQQSVRELNLSGKNRRSSTGNAGPQQELRKVIKEKVRAIEDIIERNRSEVERTANCAIDCTPLTSIGDGWPSLGLMNPTSAAPTTIHSSDVRVDRRQRQPYHVTLAEVEGGSGPTSPTSEVQTSPGWAGSSTARDDEIPKLIADLEKAGFVAYR
jgi:Ran GTPase-activating protein (RanGAP) involved in mRNA processing and transport